MERAKKEEKLIVTYFLIFLVLLIIFAVIFFSFLLPKVFGIEETKDEVRNTYNDVIRIQTKWMSFSEFKASVNSSANTSLWDDSDYLKEVINSIDEDFYKQNFVNNSWWTYEAFLNNQTATIQDWSPIEKKNEIISRVLPEYSEIISDLWEWRLTDFMFVNYVESILETFSLSMDNRIWISDITLLSDYSVWVLDNSLETNIYYIPLTLTLKWKRSDILDFLYYSNSVWKIKIENWELSINWDIDSDFKSSFRNRYLRWQWTQYSIFNNQIFDIELISFDEYIDPITTITDKYMNGTLVNYIKSTNWVDNADYKITVDLRFYIKGLPFYKIENYIKNFLLDFNRIQEEVKRNVSNTKLNNVDRQKMMDINNVLTQMSKSIIPEIQKDMRSKETVNNAFNLVNRYRETLDKYQETLDQINSNLWNTQK